jgi:hypothetical protein
MRSSIWLVSFLAVVPLTAACTSSSVIPTGDHTYPALAGNAPVNVYASEKDVPPGFEVVGIIDYMNPGKYQVLSLQDATPELQSKARTVGANGVVVDGMDPVKSGIMSTGIHVRARAIRVPAVVVTTAASPAAS